MAAIIDEVASGSGKSRTATLERLLYNLELIAKNGKLPEAIGLDFSGAAVAANVKGHGAKHLDPVNLDGGERVNFDTALLERSGKTKSGFAGVNATTSGTFRALVPDIASGAGSR